MPGSAQIGNLAVNLSLETSAFTTGAAKARAQANGLKGSLSGLGGTMKSFAVGLVGGLGIGFVASALGGLASSAVKAGSDLSESAEKVGVTAEALQELNLAATQSGVSQETLAKAMAKFNRSLGDLQNGKKAAVDAFNAIGLSADALKGKTPDQALRLVADALNRLPDVQARVAVGAQLMGRGFSELLPLINIGSKGLDEYAQKQREQGEITSEEAKELDNLSDSWDRLKIRAGVAAAKFIAMFAELASKADAWTLNWYKNRDAFIAGAEQMATRVVAYVQNMVTGVAQAITGKLNAIWDGAKAKINAVTQAFATMYDRVVGHSYVPDMVDEIGVHFGRLDSLMVAPTLQATGPVSSAFMQIANEASSSFGQLISHAESLKSFWHGLVDLIAESAKQIIASLAEMALKFLIFRAISGIFGGSLGGAATTPFGGNVGTGTTPFGGTSVPGFASGGSGVFGGFGGVDQNVLSLNGSPIARVSKGEPFSIGASNQNSRVIVELRDEMLDARIAGGAQVEILRTAPALRADTMAAMRDARRRSAR